MYIDRLVVGILIGIFTTLAIEILLIIIAYIMTKKAEKLEKSEDQ